MKIYKFHFSKMSQEEELRTAIEAKDMKKIRQLFKSCEDFCKLANTCYGKHESALSLAMETPQIAIYLLHKGADPLARNEYDDFYLGNSYLYELVVDRMEDIFTGYIECNPDERIDDSEDGEY